MFNQNIKCFEFTIFISEQRLRKVQSEIFQRVHAIVKENNLNVGITFPDYNLNGKNSQLGRRIRLFCSINDMKTIKTDSIIAKKEDDGFIEIQQIAIPSEFKKVKFVRDRTVDNYRNENHVRHEKPSSFPSVYLNSASTNQFFLIHIKKEYVENDQDNDFTFTSYCLSQKNKNSWLPDF